MAHVDSLQGWMHCVAFLGSGVRTMYLNMTTAETRVQRPSIRTWRDGEQTQGSDTPSRACLGAGNKGGSRDAPLAHSVSVGQKRSPQEVEALT